MNLDLKQRHVYNAAKMIMRICGVDLPLVPGKFPRGLNACYVSFPGPPAIVFSLELLDLLTAWEFQAVVAHELGHHLQKHHRERMLVVFLQFVALCGASVASFAGRFELALWMMLAFTFACWVRYPIERWQEIRADRFAVSLCGQGHLLNALRKMYPERGDVPAWRFQQIVRAQP